MFLFIFHDPFVIFTGHDIDLNAELLGAMEGTYNEPYMEATLYCYGMMEELIDEKYLEKEIAYKDL